ncbi:MAG: hypothetical protein J0H78_17360 [Rhizobiales bacterium]|nr:hypothetical protein [Hyphomicrobiales bacterium]
MSLIDPEAGRHAPGADVIRTGESPRCARLWRAIMQVVGKCCGDSATFTGSIAASLPQFLPVPDEMLNARVATDTKRKL